MKLAIQGTSSAGTTKQKFLLARGDVLSTSTRRKEKKPTKNSKILISQVHGN
jgi:hypothetical protein